MQAQGLDGHLVPAVQRPGNDSFHARCSESLEGNGQAMGKPVGSWIATIDSEAKGRELVTTCRPRKL
jgi:hypothetical protein